MQLIAITSLFMASTAMAGLPAFNYNQYDVKHCRETHPAVANAIEQFCVKKDIVVPSPYANYGATSRGFKNTWCIWIGGTCKPPQWVPQLYCKSQFYHMCAVRLPGNGDTYYDWSHNFGRNDCQEWVMRQGIKNPRTGTLNG